MFLSLYLKLFSIKRELWLMRPLLKVFFTRLRVRKRWVSAVDISATNVLPTKKLICRCSFCYILWSNKTNTHKLVIYTHTQARARVIILLYIYISYTVTLSRPWTTFTNPSTVYISQNNKSFIIWIIYSWSTYF